MYSWARICWPPLAAAFAKKFNVIGFDIDSSRIQDLTGGIDITGELSDHELKNVDNLSFTSNINDARNCNFYIITVPTPVDSNNIPDLSFLNQLVSQLDLF